MLQAREVEQHFEPVQHRIDVPMRLVEGAARRAGGAGPMRGFGRGNSRVEADATQTHEAERLTGHIDLPRRLPEPDARPMRKGGQMQIGLAGFSMSSCPKVATGIAPIEMGITHDQQMSVIGLANLPVHVCVLAVPAIAIATRKRNPRMTCCLIAATI